MKTSLSYKQNEGETFFVLPTAQKTRVMPGGIKGNAGVVDHGGFGDYAHYFHFREQIRRHHRQNSERLDRPIALRHPQEFGPLFPGQDFVLFGLLLFSSSQNPFLNGVPFRLLWFPEVRSPYTANGNVSGT